MLLFSTTLEIVPLMTRQKFIELVIEWNDTNPYQENIISGIRWNGEKSIRFGNEQRWLEIAEYEEKEIMAVRFEKVQPDGIKWDTDYIMDFSKMQMHIQLERSYKAETLITNAGFSTPHFISILIKAGMLAHDYGLEVSNKPIALKEDNVDLLLDIVNRKQSYRLPIIFVSKIKQKENKVSEDNYAVDVSWLASRLKGVAHVLVEEDNLKVRIRDACGEHCDYDGDIGIYFTKNKYAHKIRRFKKGNYRKKESLEKIVDLLIKHETVQQQDKLCTWQGVNNSILLQLLEIQNKRREVAEEERDKAKNETDDIYAVYDEEFAILNSKIEELTKTNEKLTAEIFGMSYKLSQSMEEPIIVYGDERDFYSGEIKDLILYVLSDVLKNTKEGSRRYDVISDILEKNDYKKLIKARKDEIKQLFNGYKTFSPSMKQQLEDMGFYFSDDGKHYKALYYNDPRYLITIAKTPSDSRSGMNIAHTISEKLF